MSQQEDDFDIADFLRMKKESTVRQQVKKLFEVDVYDAKPEVEATQKLDPALLVNELMRYDFDTSSARVFSRTKLLLPVLPQAEVARYREHLLTNYRVYSRADFPAQPEPLPADATPEQQQAYVAQMKAYYQSLLPLGFPEMDIQPGKDATNEERQAYAEKAKAFNKRLEELNVHNQKAEEILDFVSVLLDDVVFAELNLSTEGLAAAEVQMPVMDAADVRGFVYTLRKGNLETIAQIKTVTYEANEHGTLVRFWFADEETATQFAAGAGNYVEVYQQFHGDLNVEYFMLTDTIRKALAEQAAAGVETPKPEVVETRFDMEKIKSTF